MLSGGFERAADTATSVCSEDKHPVRFTELRDHSQTHISGDNTLTFPLLPELLTSQLRPTEEEDEQSYRMFLFQIFVIEKHHLKRIRKAGVALLLVILTNIPYRLNTRQGVQANNN